MAVLHEMELGSLKNTASSMVGADKAQLSSPQERKPGAGESWPLGSLTALQRTWIRFPELSVTPAPGLFILFYYFPLRFFFFKYFTLRFLYHKFLVWSKSTQSTLKRRELVMTLGQGQAENSLGFKGTIRETGKQNGGE